VLEEDGRAPCLQRFLAAQEMYNLTVDEAHTFFVGDGEWLVHNCGVSFDPTQLQKKFKHAVDFGVPGNYNKQAGGVFQQALETHITDPNTVVINGTYLGNPVTHYFNPVTGNNVMANPAGEFISGWTLSPAQRQYVLTTGNIGGHK
jgi:hypothetical protein